MGWTSSRVVTRYPGNPVLTGADLLYPATTAYNGGAVKFRGRYVMLFRTDHWGVKWDVKSLSIRIGVATSDDGLHWRPAPKPVFQMADDDILWAYDPRPTVIDDRLYMCFALDTRHGIRGGVAVTDDLEHFEVLYISPPDNRNMALFPERIDGRFARLERPFPVYGRSGDEAFDIWYAESPDGRYWGTARLVLGADQVPYSNSKIGPAAPPIRTDAGWLALFHATIKDKNRILKSWRNENWHKMYLAGAMLLDLRQPWKVIGLSRQPLMVPDDAYPYEMDGYRGGVIFPCGLIPEEDGTVKIYYGAADTVMALATARLAELIALCEPL